MIFIFWGLILFAIFMIGGLIFAFLKNPDFFVHHREYKNKGAIGERNAYLQLRKKFKIPENQIFRNVYVPKQNGKTAEIDLVVLSKKGIFVFEIKNYSGKIYGDARKSNWIQYLGAKKTYFLNPLIQNKNHVAALREFLKNYKNLNVVSVVVATTNAKWTVKNLARNDNLITNGFFEKSFPKIYAAVDSPKINREEFDEIREKLMKVSRPDAEIREKHIREIEEKYAK